MSKIELFNRRRLNIAERKIGTFGDMRTEIVFVQKMKNA
jgi:hypothetical protein